MAIHAPITGAPNRATAFQPHRLTRYRRLLALLSPADIGDAIDALIARLDAMQGDADSEDDDPGGTWLDAGELDEGELMPRYGDDQDAGPINKHETHRAYLARLRGAIP